MKRYWLYLVCVILISGYSTAQTMVSSAEILAAARHDPAYTLQGQHLAYIGETNQHLPFLDQISLRTQTDRFDPDRQEYTARFSVNGLSEIEKQQLLHQTDASAKAGLQRVYLHESLLQRYQALAAYRHLLQQLSIQKELKQVYTDKVNVLKKMVLLDEEADVDELIKNEFDLDELDLDIIEGESLLGYTLKTIQAITPAITGDWVPDTTDFITIPEIEIRVSQLPDSIVDNPEIIVKQAKAGVIDAEYDLERAKSNQVLDFFQLRYANVPYVQDLSRELSLGFSFFLPFKGSSRLNMSELLIEKNEAEQNILLYQNDLAERVTNGRLKLQALSRQYQLAQKQLEDNQARFTLEQRSIPQTDAPGILLRARELQLKRQLNLSSIEREIINQYISILDLTGMLSAIPSVNYLSANFETY